MRNATTLVLASMALGVGAASCVHDEGGGLRPFLFASMSLVPDDFTSDVRVLGPSSAPLYRDVLGLAWQGQLEDASLDAYFTEHVTLVSLATGAPVPGHVEPGIVRTRGERVRAPTIRDGGYSFVSDTDLEDGWYVLLVDARSLDPTSWDNGPAVFIDEGDADVHVRRVHVGSRPTWVATSVTCGDACSPSVTFSEPVRAADAGRWALAIDEAEADCGAPVVDGRAMYWRCPSAPPGTSWRVEQLEPGAVMLLDGASRSQTVVAGGIDSVTVPVDPDLGIDVALATL